MSWLLKIYLITFYLYSNVSSYIILPTDYTNQDAESLSKCIVKIRDDDIVNNPTIFVTKRTGIQIKDDDESYLNTMIETITNEGVPIIIGYYVDFNNIKSRVTKFMSIMPKGNLIVFSVFNNCETVIQTQDNSLEINVKYLFLIKVKLNEGCINKIENQKKYVQELDVTFIFKDDFENKYNFLTFIPQRKEDNCNGSTAVQINTCVAGSLDEAVVFPKKSLTNLGGCPIIMGLLGSFPHVTFKHSSILTAAKYSNHSVTDLSGSDVKIMKIIAERLNATATFVILVLQERYIEYFSATNQIQVTGGGLTIGSMGDSMTVTATYGAYNVIWGYAAIRPVRHWSNFISNVNGIYYCLVFYIIYSFIWKGVTHFDGHAVPLKETLLYGWGALVGAASLQPARSMKQKMLKITYLVMCIHLSTYFSTQLYSFLVIQKPPQMIRTHDEILASDRNTYLRSIFRDPKYYAPVKRPYSCQSTLDCAYKTVNNNGISMFFETEFYSAQVYTAVKDEARLLRVTENVLSRYLHFILGRRNLSNNLIQKIATSLFEAGISQKLYVEAVGAEMVATANMASKITESNDYTCESGCSISLPQIAPVFYLWLVGCAFSCLVFLLELLWNIKSLRSFCIFLKKRNKIPPLLRRNKNTGDINLKK